MDLSKFSGINLATVSGALIAGTTSTYTTSVAVDYLLDGRLYQFATKTNQATPTTDINTGAAFVAVQPDEGCIFSFCANSSLAVAVAQGPIEKVDGDTDEFKISPSFPPIPDTHTIFGYVIIKSDGTASAWTMGSSSWAATGITDTFVNAGLTPSRPSEV